MWAVYIKTLASIRSISAHVTTPWLCWETTGPSLSEGKSWFSFFLSYPSHSGSAIQQRAYPIYHSSFWDLCHLPGKRLLPTEFGQQEGKVSRHVEWVTKSRGDSWFPSAGKMHWDRQMASLRWRTSGCPQAGREKPSPRHLHIYFLFVSPEIFCELIQEALDPFQTGGAVSNTIWTGLQGS